MNIFFTISYVILSMAYHVGTSAHVAIKEETHKGKVTTAYGVYEGEFNIKLNEENSGIVIIKLTDIRTKSKQEQTGYNETISVNVMMVKEFETNGVVYILKNIALEDGKSLSNCCLRVIASSTVAKLAYWGVSDDANKCFVMTKYNNAFMSLKLIRYYTFSKLFAGCQSINEKTKYEGESYREYFNNLSQDQLLVLWRSRISEFNNCNK